MDLTAYAPWHGDLTKTLRIMKLTAILLLGCFLQVSAKGYSQAITLSEKNAPLEKVFRAIEKQTGYLFWYDNSLLKDAKRVTIEAKGSSLVQVLEICFKEQLLTYSIINKTVVVKKKVQSSNIDVSLAQAIDINIKGRVLNENGEPLEGITVTVKGSNKATATNKSGEFILGSVAENAILVFSGTNIETYEIRINGRSELVINVKTRISKLDEVKIIGYGTTTQRTSTGSVSKVSGSDISRQPVTNPLQALSGRVPGLLITQGSGLPGTTMSVQIRGQNSIAASNNPLYIVDGVPFGAGTTELIGISSSPNTSAGFGNPFNTISPSDIESIEILKDADATAIYGSRAANGVILITTKKGKTGKARLNTSISTGSGKITRMPAMLSTEQYLRLRHDAFTFDGITPTISNAPDLLLWDTTKYTDWQKYFYGNSSTIFDGNASLTGGNDRVRFLLSGAYHRENTVLPTDAGYNRTNIHSSIDYVSENKKLQVSSSAFFVSEFNKQNSLTIRSIFTLPPNYPGSDSVGRIYWHSSFTSNPLADLLSYSKTHTTGLNGNLSIRYNIFSNLNLKVNLGYNRIFSDQLWATPIAAQNPTNNPTGRTLFANQFIQTALAEPQLNYSYTHSKLKIEYLLGTTFQQSRTKGDMVFASNYTNDLLIESMANGALTPTGSNNIDYKYSSVFTRFTGTWANKYIINGNFRRDGSSRFGNGYQYGNFGSLGAGWIFTSEQFSKSSKGWLSYGKLRGSYGISGNDGIPDYGYLATYQASGTYAGTNVLNPARIANPNYRWEINRKLEAAIELGFFNNRILITTAFFRNRSDNQLVGFPLPALTGFTSYQANLPAVVQNTGLELEVNTVNIQRKYLKWSTSLNITIPKNKLVAYPGIISSSYARMLVVGLPLSNIQKYQFTGVDPGTGLTTVKDLNDDGIYSTFSSFNNQGGDFVYAGKTYPEWYGGINNEFSFKQFEFSFFFQIVHQQGYNLNNFYSLNGTLSNVWTTFLDYWKKPGDITDHQKPTTTSGTSSSARSRYANSTATFSDASFARLKNIFLSYSPNLNFLKKLKMSQLKLFAEGQNLFTITKYKGYDPEQAGVSTIYLPPLRVVSIGIQASF